MGDVGKSPLAALSAADYELHPDDLDRVLTPALVVYADKVRENLRRILAYLGGDPDRWRPHVKTTKTPAVWRELIAAGVRQFKCATTREAQHLLTVCEEQNVDADVLIAYPLVGPALARAADLAGRVPEGRLSVLVEDVSLLQDVSSRLGVFIDVNPGMNRTGVPADEGDRVIALARAAGPRFRGVHFYEGHVHSGNADQDRALCFGLYRQLLEIHDSLAREGIPVEEIITSGTPGFLHATIYRPFRELENTRHRVSPGTVVFHDVRSSVDVEALDLVPAAVVVTRVVSHPTEGIVTADAGSKSIAAEQGDPCALVIGRPDLVAQRPSEEHLPFVVLGGDAPARGTALYLVPHHICPTVNLAESALWVEDGRVQRLVEISARAHDVWLEQES